MPATCEASSLVALLVQRCASTTNLRKARQLHGLILTSLPTITPSPYVNNNILSMYARCGSIGDACQLFDKMPHRSIVSFNALISAFSRGSLHAISAFNLFHQLEIEGLRPNGSTYTSLLQASSLLEKCTPGSMLHARLVKSGFAGDTCVQTSLLGMYSNCGDLESAENIFNPMVDKDAVAWNSMILGYMKNENIASGLQLYGSMVRSSTLPTQFTYSMILIACSRQIDLVSGKAVHAQLVACVFRRIEYPDLVSWNSMISGYSENGLAQEAMEMFVQFQRISSFKPDQYTFAAIISATATSPYSNYGKPLQAQVIKAGYERSVHVGSTLISMYFNNKETGCAQKVFSSILEKDTVLWTDMISGHCRMADGENAVKFFHLMRREGLKVDSFALSSTLSACADLVILKQGEMIHCLAIKTGYDFEISVCGSLIDMYAKNGELQAAESIISTVSSPDLKCWNAMLGGYGHHGKAVEAMKVFDEILKNNLSPDKVTFISLLSACSHDGWVDKGKLLWNCMKENGLRPGPKHYSCMVSLLSRAGLLEEAERMIVDSPFSEDNVDLWKALLSSCITHKNFEMGVRAAEQVLDVDGDDCATHVLLSNLYAAAGKWGDVIRTRRKMKHLVLEKDPGLSWIEVMNEIHVFCSGDQSHPMMKEMHTELLSIKGNMKSKVDRNFTL
ncbi:unnamed protein product [Thlaspi arvense]|uniref:Pentatricopeptide repeat-containing protein n=1 Tax=Thlaspi arvense TaxID=13288 RepID=A0AAU9RWZ8_THLAR|nr:unnamed protein product [Thlaspi arvense]